MEGLALKYHKELQDEKSFESKCSILQEFITETIGIDLEIGLIRKMLKLFGSQIIFDAVIIYLGKDSNTLQRNFFTNYLWGICRNLVSKDENKSE